MLKSTASALILFATAVLGFSPSAKAGDIISTVAEYNGTPSFDFALGDYPLPPALIGDFTFTIPTGFQVIGGTISGTFGNNDVSVLTAASDYYLDGTTVAVAQCDDALTFSETCDATASSPTEWTYTLSQSDLSNLSTEIASGNIDLNVIQNFAISVQTGVTTLDLVVASPEPATIFVFCGGLAGIALLRRFRKA